MDPLIFAGYYGQSTLFQRWGYDTNRQSFKRQKCKARRFCVCEVRRKPRGVKA